MRCQQLGAAISPPGKALPAGLINLTMLEFNTQIRLEELVLVQRIYANIAGTAGT